MKKEKFQKIAFIFTGFFALIWFLIRVIPKPSRASYPCQRAAFPVASAFVLWVAGISGSAALIMAMKKFFRKNWIALSILGMASLVVIGCTKVKDNPPVPELAVEVEAPIGTPQGTNPGRVVWGHNPSMVQWDGENGQYWTKESVDQDKLDQLLSDSLKSLTNGENDAEAWEILFSYTNQQRGREELSYQVGEKIAVKINENNQDNPYAQENVAIDASPHMVLALLRQLVLQLGAAEEDIYVYDALRPISDPVLELCQAEFPGVQFMGGLGYPNNLRTDFEWTEEAIHYSNGMINRSDARSVPTFVLESDYIINMAILKSHDNITGVTLCGKNHYGSIGRPDQLHSFTHPRDYGHYSPQVDIFGHEDIWGKTVLYMIDGLFGAIGPSGCVSAPKMWESEPFNNDWPSSLFLSQDIVAIDSVGYDFLAAETDLWNHSDAYLHEAALADNPPSETMYDPEGDGVAMHSLGVHEHWNNPQEKEYTSIDLVTLSQ